MMNRVLPTTSPALADVRILSLALNLPGPAAMMRLREMGARCTKLEAPAPGAATSDPMAHYCPSAYAQMHEGVDIVRADLKTPQGQEQLATLLEQTDVLLTSFRPAAIVRLKLDWQSLRQRHPGLSLVQVVGAGGDRASEAGHDLTYQAEAGLVPAMQMPPSLLADMAGALMAVEAVLKAVIVRQRSGLGCFQEVALLDGARWLAMPRQWGMTLPDGVTGGAHAGYGIYPCQDGRVAVAALEPHFAERLWLLASASDEPAPDMMSPAAQRTVASFFAGRSRAQLDEIAVQQDIPLLTLPAVCRESW